MQKYLKKEGGHVRQISWFGKQTALSMAELISLRGAGYRVLNINWMPFNNLWQMHMVRKTCDVLGIKVVWTVHNLRPHEPQFGSIELDEEAMKYMSAWAKAAVVHSERTAIEFRDKYGSSIPITVVPLANYSDVIRSSDVTASRKKFGFRDDRIMVLMLGPSRWNKGIRSFLNVLESLSEDYVGVLVGGCKDNGIRDLIYEHKRSFPDKYVVRLEHLTDEEAADYYAASDIVFMPFEYITTSGSIMDALSHGKAIVTTDMGNLDMLVKDGINGYLVHSEEEAILRLKNMDRHISREMGEQSLNISKLFDWKDTAHCYLNIYRSVLG